MPAIAVKFCGAPSRSYMKPGAALPVIGTDIWGLPRNGIVSAGVSQGSIFGCCLKSVNQEHAPSASSGSSAMRRLALTTHLLGSVLPKNVHGGVGLVGRSLHPHAEVAARKAGIVTDGHRQTWNVREAEHGEHGGQTTDEHHDFEAKNGVRHPARDGFAADDDRPVVRHPDREPVAERHAGEAHD